MSEVYLIKCCTGSTIDKVLGPYGDVETAEAVLETVERHFWNKGDRHVVTESREVVERAVEQ